MRVAAGVFAERGYRDGGMREIAARIGVKPAALYYYFPSKEKLLEAICNYGVMRLYNQMVELQGSDVPIDRKIELALRFHLTPLIEQEFYVHAFLFLRRELGPEARKPLNELARSYESLWEAMLVEGQTRGTIGKDIDRRIAVLGILGMCASVGRWSKSTVNADAEYMIAFFTRFVIQGLRPGAKLEIPPQMTSGLGVGQA